MEQQQTEPMEAVIIPEREVTTSISKNFIEANTKNVGLLHLKNDCTIPVFSKDNECTISHQEFIEAMLECAQSFFKEHSVSLPVIRASHVVKGRIPSAIGKPVKELMEHEKTIYYERMMFAFEIPSISETINGNELKLTIGGIRAYNQENLYSKKSFEKFKVFIGFNNRVCTNLCISTDGYAGDIKVATVSELKKAVFSIFENYNMQLHLKGMEELPNYSISESQFAQLIGKIRLYNYLPKEERQLLAPMRFTDSQINTIAKDYYGDRSFCRDFKGEINLWQLYNLFTGSNKSSYIDSFLERSVNAHEFVQTLGNSLENKSYNWFLHYN